MLYITSICLVANQDLDEIELVHRASVEWGSFVHADAVGRLGAHERRRIARGCGCLPHTDADVTELVCVRGHGVAARVAGDHHITELLLARGFARLSLRVDDEAADVANAFAAEDVVKRSHSVDGGRHAVGRRDQLDGSEHGPNREEVHDVAWFRDNSRRRRVFVHHVMERFDVVWVCNAVVVFVRSNLDLLVQIDEVEDVDGGKSLARRFAAEDDVARLVVTKKFM